MSKHLLKIRSSHLLVAMLILQASCLSQKDFIIDSDYSYQGTFKKYKTFSFMVSAENDSTYHKAILEKTITSRMGAQGYSVKKTKPDLLVMYKLFHDDFSFRGYSQPQFESWVFDSKSKEKSSDKGFEDEFFKDEAVEGEEYNVNNYSMNDGTLLVIFYDRKKKQSVWQGYASGVFNPERKDADKSIKIAISKIFNEFRLIADGYVLKGG